MNAPRKPAPGHNPYHKNPPLQPHKALPPLLPVGPVTPPPPEKSTVTSTAWDAQAAWYDDLHGNQGSEMYQDVVLPAVLRTLAAKPGQRVLDLGCGQGVVGRMLADNGIASVGVDLAADLIAAARQRARPEKLEDYRVGDAQQLAKVLGRDAKAAFDHATAILCLQDMDPISTPLADLAAAVKPGGRLVAVLTHPVLRVPRLTRWGDERGARYRRVDAYLQPQTLRLETHPGTENSPTTASFHRPLGMLISALGAAHWGVIAAEELTNPKRGTQGKASAAEDRAAREFPLFLLLVAQRLP